MVGLLDIAPTMKEVHGVDVYGISSESLVILFRRFPSLAELSVGNGINAQELLKIGPEAVAAIIAAGCGSIGDEKAEKIASKFGVEMQMDLLTEIGGLTFPSGFGPFVARLASFSKSVQGEVTRVRDMKSPPQSKPLSETDFPPVTPGP